MNIKKLFVLGCSVAVISASANDQENIDPNFISNKSFTRNAANAWHFCDSAENPGVCKSMDDFLEYCRSSQIVLPFGMSNWFNKKSTDQLPVEK